MTALLSSDWHLNDNPRDFYRHEFIETIPAIAEKHGAEEIIILGDLTDEKDNHSAWLVNRIVDYIFAMTKVGPVTVMRGNHDYIAIDDPFFAFLGRLPGVRFVSNPTRFAIDSLGECLFLPHTRQHKLDWKGIKHKKGWVFAHNTFAGADVGHGKIMDGIPLEALPKDCQVISGDVHVPQRLGNVTYVGAPYTIDFGDDYKPRMLLIDKYSMTFIACKGSQKRLIELDSSNKTFDANSGDIVKIRYHLKSNEIGRWGEIKEMLIILGKEKGLVIDSVQPVLQDSGESFKVKLEAPKTDNQVVREFAHKRGVSEKVLKTGFYLMQKS